MSEGEIGANFNGLFQFPKAPITIASHPKRPTHGPVGIWVPIIGDQPLTCGGISEVTISLLVTPMLKRTLSMGERKARVGPSEGRIKLDRILEEFLR